MYSGNPAKLIAKGADGKDTIPFSSLLKPGVTVESIISKRIEQKVMEFDHAGLPERIQRLKALGLHTMKVTDEQVETVNAYMQVRYIIVHNVGRIDAQYLKKTRRCDVTNGGKIEVSYAMVMKAFADIWNFGAAIDAAWSEKFSEDVSSNEAEEAAGT